MECLLIRYVLHWFRTFNCLVRNYSIKFLIKLRVYWFNQCNLLKGSRDAEKRFVLKNLYTKKLNTARIISLAPLQKKRGGGKLRASIIVSKMIIFKALIAARACRLKRKITIVMFTSLMRVAGVRDFSCSATRLFRERQMSDPDRIKEGFINKNTLDFL